ncbi:hypothetical protein [Acidithiobacillus acidisediminis]|uniref:hypothetical protein n=1 Tax=Acidithiobacillus acidisediminis TaxID=2937799 RepID=UPI00200E9C1C|nr:hypothetical protein [Acidithiobacillus sp. S30A2]
MNPITMVFVGIVFVLFVIAGVVAGISLLHGSEAGTFVQDVTTIQGAVNKVFGVQGNYSGVSSNCGSGTANPQCVIPEALQATTPIGGTFNVQSGGAGLPNYEYEVEVSGVNLSASICKQIVSQVDTVSTLVDGTAVGNANNTPTGSQAQSACGSGGVTSLGFVFSNGQ